MEEQLEEQARREAEQAEQVRQEAEQAEQVRQEAEQAEQVRQEAEQAEQVRQAHRVRIIYPSDTEDEPDSEPELHHQLRLVPSPGIEELTPQPVSKPLYSDPDIPIRGFEGDYERQVPLIAKEEEVELETPSDIEGEYSDVLRINPDIPIRGFEGDYERQVPLIAKEEEVELETPSDIEGEYTNIPEYKEGEYTNIPEYKEGEYTSIPEYKEEPEYGAIGNTREGKTHIPEYGREAESPREVETLHTLGARRLKRERSVTPSEQVYYNTSEAKRQRLQEEEEEEEEEDEDDFIDAVEDLPQESEIEDHQQESDIENLAFHESAETHQAMLQPEPVVEPMIEVPIEPESEPEEPMIEVPIEPESEPEEPMIEVPIEPEPEPEPIAMRTRSRVVERFTHLEVNPTPYPAQAAVTGVVTLSSLLLSNKNTVIIITLLCLALFIVNVLMQRLWVFVLSLVIIGVAICVIFFLT